MKRITARHILFFSFLVLLLVWSLVRTPDLKGAIEKPVYNDFNFESWFNGEYQEQVEKYVNESFGFRSFFVRINNQIDYSLYNKLHASAVVMGKEQCLYEIDYIRAYCGTDFVGKD